MAATCIPALNYVAFLLFYILCFYAVTRENTKIVGYGVLFVIHVAFILFFINNLAKIMNTYDKKIFPPHWLTSLALVSIFFSLGSHAVSFILIFMTLTYLRTKYDTQNGVSLSLDSENSRLLNTFNAVMFSDFALCVVLLLMFFYDISGFTFLSVKLLNTSDIYPFMDDPSLDRIGMVIFPLLGIIFSVGVIYLSYLQFTTANSFSRLYSRDISTSTSTILQDAAANNGSPIVTAPSPTTSSYTPTPTTRTV